MIVFRNQYFKDIFRDIYILGVYFKECYETVRFASEKNDVNMQQRKIKRLVVYAKDTRK